MYWTRALELSGRPGWWSRKSNYPFKISTWSGSRDTRIGMCEGQSQRARSKTRSTLPCPNNLSCRRCRLVDFWVWTKKFLKLKSPRSKWIKTDEGKPSELGVWGELLSRVVKPSCSEDRPARMRWVQVLHFCCHMVFMKVAPAHSTNIPSLIAKKFFRANLGAVGPHNLHPHRI